MPESVETLRFQINVPPRDCQIENRDPNAARPTLKLRVDLCVARRDQRLRLRVLTTCTFGLRSAFHDLHTLNMFVVRAPRRVRLRNESPKSYGSYCGGLDVVLNTRLTGEQIGYHLFRDALQVWLCTMSQIRICQESYLLNLVKNSRDAHLSEFS